MRFTTLLAGTATLSALLAATACAQQRRPAPRPEIERAPMRAYAVDEGDRAVLGISTASSSSERDTLGVLVTAITAGGPAEKAGIEEGNRIAAVNGVNLRLSAADAGEPDMRGLVSRRLTRELSKVKPGDEVELRVYANGAFKTVRVRTVAADELPGRRRVLLSRADRREEWESRAVLGLNLSAGGSRRDTLGALVVRVESDGPAEKAGLVEGDRIVSINGVDLRVARDDAGDGWVSNAKVNRFRRAMQDVKPGDRVELRVYSGGQTKTVQVVAVRAGELYDGGRRSAWFGGIGEVGPMPPLPPVPPIPPMPPMEPFVGYVDGFDFSFDVDPEAFVEVKERAADAALRALDALDGVRVHLDGMTHGWDDGGTLIQLEKEREALRGAERVPEWKGKTLKGKRAAVRAELRTTSGGSW